MPVVRIDLLEGMFGGAGEMEGIGGAKKGRCRRLAGIAILGDQFGHVARVLGRTVPCRQNAPTAVRRSMLELAPLGLPRREDAPFLGLRRRRRAALHYRCDAFASHLPESVSNSTPISGVAPDLVLPRYSVGAL